MMIKRCYVCGRFLGENKYGWVNKNHTIRKSICIKCEYNYTHYIYSKNKTNRIKYQNKYYSENKKDRLRYQSEYRKINRYKVNELKRRNDAKKINQSPTLTLLEQQWMDSIYKMCNTLNVKFGQGMFHVDHIISLDKGGLHHPSNLQIIPAKQNLEKNNKDPREFYGRHYDFIVRGII